MQFLSPAQCVGYVALILGVAAFLQTADRRLKLLNGVQCIAYAIHFALLGNPTAAASSLVSSARSFLSVWTRSLFAAALLVTANLIAGMVFSRGGAGWIPVAASSAATVAIFLLSGIPLRLVLLGCTCLWLVNNVLCRSVGGIVLESSIAVASVSTIIRLAARRGDEASAGGT
jgi:vacuolar-type H+-ATPase subunit I/STV1